MSNEITVKVIGSSDKLLKTLTTKNFKPITNFSLDDYYLIPKDLNLKELNAREILAKAVIVRRIIDKEEIIQKITFKKKEINEAGEIIKQTIINCTILDFKSAISLFESLGYFQIMNIKEKDTVYSNDWLRLALKFVEGGDILIEIETDDNFKTVESLKSAIDELDLPIEKGNYFVKKAEDALNIVLANLK